jgi:hypothetical protein
MTHGWKTPEVLREIERRRNEQQARRFENATTAKPDQPRSMMRRALLKLLGALGVASAGAGTPPSHAQRPVPVGPWYCVHDKGQSACNGIAFIASVMPVVGEIMNPEHFRRLDGTIPRVGERMLCGACGADLGRENEFPLTLLPSIPQPQPSRRHA